MDNTTEQITVSMNELYIQEEFNYRGAIHMAEINGLAQNIKDNGLMQPVIVAKLQESHPKYAEGYRYKLLAGFRRTTACKKLLNWTEIPACAVSVHDEIDELCVNITENEERSDVPFHQSALALGRLRDMNLSEAQIIKKLKKTRGWVQTRLQYLELPDDIREGIREHNESGNYNPVTQDNIKQLRSILINNDADECFEAFKELRVGLCAGHKRINMMKYKNKAGGLKTNTKRTRNGTDMSDMINTIYDSLSEQRVNPMAKTIAWVLGNITDEEFFEVCEDWAVSNGLTFDVSKALN
jgi:ParB family chromosome partitioning protein